MKKYLCMVLAVAMLAMVFAGCAAPAPETKIDKIKKAGELVMLTNAAFPPFEFVGTDGSTIGVDVEIAKAIADELGVKLNVVDMDFDGIVGAIQSGKGDVGAAGMTIKPDRLENVDFTSEYFEASQYMIVQADNTTINTIADVKNVAVGVQSGTTGYFYAEDELTDVTVEPYKTAIDAAMALAAGKIDVVIIDELPARAIVKENAGLKIIEEALTQESYAIAIAKENTDLKEVANKVIDKLIADGTIENWVVQYSNK